LWIRTSAPSALFLLLGIICLGGIVRLRLFRLLSNVLRSITNGRPGRFKRTCLIEIFARPSRKQLGWFLVFGSHSERQRPKLAAQRGEVGPLDFDPFIDAQDWTVAELDIAVTDTAPGRASTTVKFTNLGKATTVLLDLVPSKRVAHSRHHLAGRRQASNAARHLRALRRCCR
jgi:hypothetical protein